MIDSSYLDRDGFLKSHREYRDTDGDGVYLTIVGGLLGVLLPDYVDRVVFACIDPKTGLLFRRPDNTGSGGSQQQDGWMALSVWLLYRRNSVLARGLLLSAVTRGFYMKHKPFEFEGKTLWQRLEERLKPALIRHPKIWIALFVAAYPNRFVSWFCSRMIQILLFSGSGPIEDASGQGQYWICMYFLKLSKNPLPLRSYLAGLRDRGTTLTEIMSTPRNGGLPFWDADHVVIAGFAGHEAEVLA